ncbi:MerR family transcriptional regulator [Lactobacillus mulieris]|jgi:transcriptional regulator|uniref:MerR family transcriptional regulator n=1 Tax=Lactobacillus TaxID=1578 RepID=UPI00019C770F|nr:MULTISPECIES: MerR family transcriptional regulator [Lactobacillus]EFH29347.1 transcriptional regulator, MerR family [Lactobacillus jensenii JV-V16]KAA9243611.1 MerR family transcriptional regulator [Lactobacillus jensenii]MCW8094809.1 MerR family transcriptional regulator [Lactobacillus mulieris]MCW8124304.1 MerR family transcriptional regulator [Lactobacillus mulieris]MCZ9599338.1 MerR family transcriptional regulator [Lactobacillus mulieris]
MYSIGQVAKMFDLPISTLRYYDKEGLFPDMQRKGNQRIFTEAELECLRVIACMKKSGLEIKDIKQYFDWCREGSSTYKLRQELFLKQRSEIEDEIKKLQATKAMLDFKCWYYDQLIDQKVKDEAELQTKIAQKDMPTPVKKAYELSH